MPTWVSRSPLPLGSARLGSPPAALGSLRSCLLPSASSRCALKASARRRGTTEHVRAGRRALRRDTRAWMAPRGRYREGWGGARTRGGGLGELHVKLFGDLTPFSPSGLLGLKTDSPLWNSEIKGANFRAGFLGGGGLEVVRSRRD